MAFLIVVKYLLPANEFSDCLKRVRAEVDKLAAVLPAAAMNKVYAASGLYGSWRKLDVIRK